MNRLCYRVIFNKTLGRLVVVSEKTRSCGKSDNAVVGGGKTGVASTDTSSATTLQTISGFGFKSLAASILTSLLGLSLTSTALANNPTHQSPTQTTIIADTAAAKHLQPIVLPTANGRVSVNIQTPNDKGLSNNHYSQFDVAQAGVVLNNNRKAVNTQLAGFVAANPLMARGEATTILNQINSSNPSHLNGFIEIAGSKADVIIANPQGLQINGTGFINAGNVHLAAANPVVQNGQVAGYQVLPSNQNTNPNPNSHIAVHGKLNLQDTNYAALIAKSAQINEQIFAGKQLEVITGDNEVGLVDGQFDKLSVRNQGNDNQTNTSQSEQQNNLTQQGIALDVAALGGMYAGQIRLIGTDKGFGVNNAGEIVATGLGAGVSLGADTVGSLTLDSQGNLVNTGALIAKDKITINTHNHHARNDGTIGSQQANIFLNAAGVHNTGTIHSAQTSTLNTQILTNQGDIYGGALQISTDTINNQGKLLQTGTGKLAISTQKLNNTDGAVIGTDLYVKNNDGVNTGAGNINNQNTNPSTNQNSNAQTNTSSTANQQGSTNNQTRQNKKPASTNGFIKTTSLTNQGNQALIVASDSSLIDIQASSVVNHNQSSIATNSLDTNTLTNTDSRTALESIDWQLEHFNNTDGQINAKQHLVIDSNTDIINRNGSLSSGGDLQLSTQGELDNTQGIIHAKNSATITANSIQGANSPIAAVNTNNNSAINNTATSTIAAKNLTISQQANYTHTANDNLIAQNLTLTTQGSFINQANFTAADALNLTANSINNKQTASIAAQNTTINSQTNITNTGLINGDNTLIKAKDTIDNNAGRIYGTQLSIQADTLNNTPTKLIKDNKATNNKDKEQNHTAPVIAARSRLDIGVNHLNNNSNPDRAGKFNKDFDNQALITSQGSLHIGGQLDDNNQVASMGASKAKTVINKGATIESAGEMVIGAEVLKNENADYQKHAVEIDRVSQQTFYRNREQYGKQTLNKSSNPDDLGVAPMASVYDCQDANGCLVAYANDSAIWQYFKLAPPATPAPVPTAYLQEPKLPQGFTDAMCANSTDAACISYNKDLKKYQTVMGPALQWLEDNAERLDALNLAIAKYNTSFYKPDGSTTSLAVYTTDEAYLGPTSKKGAPNGALYVKDANGHYQRVGEEIDEITVDLAIYEDRTKQSDPARMVAGKDLHIYGDKLINDKSQMNAGKGFAIRGDTVVQTPDNGLSGQTVKKTENGTYVSRTVVSSRLGTRHKRIDIAHGEYIQEFKPLASYQLPILSTPIATAATAAPVADLAVLNSSNPTAPTITLNNTDAIILSNSLLYTLNETTPNKPVIESDPAFVNYKNWLSSDYMLKALQTDPNHIHKRLGDGYYEQQKLAEQYYILTGKQLSQPNSTTNNQQGQAGNETAFKQLMDNGITFARIFGLTVGTALTAEQMAALTTDIVWLVETPIVYTSKTQVDKDGKPLVIHSKALMPKLYLRAANANTGTLSAQGAYSGISGKDVDVKLVGTLDSTGNLIAENRLSVQADSVDNKGIVQGSFVQISTNKDLINRHTIQAKQAMQLTAGGSVRNESQTLTTGTPLGENKAQNQQQNHQDNNQSSAHTTAISQVAQIVVGDGNTGKQNQTNSTTNNDPQSSKDNTALPTLTIQAGKAVIFTGAKADNQTGKTLITAKDGIALNAITESSHIHAISSKDGDNNYFKHSQSTDVGSAITGKGDVVLVAGNQHKQSQSNQQNNNNNQNPQAQANANTGLNKNTGSNPSITGKAATITSKQGAVVLVAEGDVRFVEGRQTEQLDTATRFTDSSLLSKKTQQDTFGLNASNALTNSIEGKRVTIQAGGDIGLTATKLVSETDIALTSKGDITIDSAQNTLESSSHSLTKKSGLFSTAPTSITLGKQKTTQDAQNRQITHTGSLVAALDGNITINAAGNYTQIASEVLAFDKAKRPSQLTDHVGLDSTNTNTNGSPNTHQGHAAKGNILIKAANASIESKNEQYSGNQAFAQKTTGLTASVSSSLASDIQSIQSVGKAVKDTDSDRMKLAGALAVVSKTKSVYDNIANKNLGNIRAQATIGSQSQRSSSQNSQEQNHASHIHTDGNLYFDITGSDEAQTNHDGNLTITGSSLQVGNNLYQRVDGDVIYQASTQHSSQTSSNKAQGFGVGVYAQTSLGSNDTRQGFTISANTARGNSSEHGVTHSNTKVQVGGTTYNDITGNFTLDGANLNTTQLTGRIGGDLIVNSRQDTYALDSNSKQAGFSADIDFNGKPQALSVNGGKSNLQADYAQVTNQSGILTHSSDLKVAGQGIFTGGYLATDKGRNQTEFAKGIRTTDISNHLNYQGSAISGGFSISANQVGKDGKESQNSKENQGNNNPQNPTTNQGQTAQNSTNNQKQPSTNQQNTDKNQNKSAFTAGISPIGFGTIKPVNKTSTTYAAVTDMAGKAEVGYQDFTSKQSASSSTSTDINNREPAKNPNPLNEIIDNAFAQNKAGFEKELGAQQAITAAFGEEAPKRVAEFSDSQIQKLAKQLENPNLSDDETNTLLSQMSKWSEGGEYRAALHGATSILLTGNAAGVASAATTAIATPKVDQYLQEKGIDENTRTAALLALSAGIGVSGSAVANSVNDGNLAQSSATASAANNLGQVQFNYLTHDQFSNKILCIRAGLENCNLKYDSISKEQDLKLKQACEANPNSHSCYQQIKSALEYIGTSRNHYAKSSDINSSTTNVLNVANGVGYGAIKTLDDRANYFGAMYGYTEQPWFRVAEDHSRYSLKLANETFYKEWIDEAGSVIMRNGRKDFQDIYHNYQHRSLNWSYDRLVNEQADKELQVVHTKHYNSWNIVSKAFVDSMVKLKTGSSSAKFLNSGDRIDVGCSDMKDVPKCQ